MAGLEMLYVKIGLGRPKRGAWPREPKQEIIIDIDNQRTYWNRVDELGIHHNAGEPRLGMDLNTLIEIMEWVSEGKTWEEWLAEKGGEDEVQ